MQIELKTMNVWESLAIMQNIAQYVQEPQFEVGKRCLTFICPAEDRERVAEILNRDYVEFNEEFLINMEKKMASYQPTPGLWINKKLIIDNVHQN